MIVNNFVSSHSPSANCEEDVSEGALDSLKYFVYNAEAYGRVLQQTEHHSNLDSDIDKQFKFRYTTPNIIIQNNAYIAGYLAKSILKCVAGCNTCKRDLLSESITREHELIQFRRYNSKTLLQPDTSFVSLFCKCNDVLHYYLPKLCDRDQLKRLMINKICMHITNNFLCEQHNLLSIFFEKFVVFYIHSWITNINKILRGDDIRNINDPIKKKALERYKKFKLKGNKIRQMKHLQ